MRFAARCHGFENSECRESGRPIKTILAQSWCAEFSCLRFKTSFFERFAAFALIESTDGETVVRHSLRDQNRSETIKIGDAQDENRFLGDRAIKCAIKCAIKSARTRQRSH